MMPISRIVLNCIIACFLSSNMAVAKAQVMSLYTDLSGKSCKLIEKDEETGNSVLRCPGVGGFQLLIAEDDARMSVNVISPDRTEHSLDYWNVVTSSLSSLGRKAEWRVVKHGGKITPIALIVRVNAFEQENSEHPKAKSYLVIARISAEEICVTDKLPADRDANQKARQAADSAAKRACIKP